MAQVEVNDFDDQFNGQINNQKSLRNQLEQRFGVSIQTVIDFCQNHGITELAVFGSVLRDDFKPTSDIDLLVTFSPHVQMSLLGLVRLENQFKVLLHRDVDLVSRQAIAESENWIRRQNILGSAEILYVAG